jgi:hypothetical protein
MRLRILLFLSLVISVAAQQQAGRPQTEQGNTKATGAESAMPMQMPLVVPLFIENGDFTSTVVLVNASAERTYADTVVRDSEGHLVAQRRVRLAPTSQTKVGISDLLRNAPAHVTSGSVIIIPSHELMGMAVAGQMTMTYRKYPQPSYIDEETAMPSAEGSQELHGVADAGDGPPLLSVVNLSEAPQLVSVTCIPEHSPSSMRAVEMVPSGMAVFRACDEGDSHSSAIEEAEAEHVHHGALGILLQTDGAPGSFAAFGLNPHRRGDSVNYSSIVFSDPKMIQSSGILFVGVPIGLVPLLSDSGLYRPTLSLANFGPKAATVTVKLATTPEAGGAGSKVTTIKTLRLDGHSSTTLDLNAPEVASGIENSFLLESDALPGQVGAKMVSYNKSRSLRVELLGKDKEHLENAGLHPWSTELGSESTLLLFNPSAKANSFDIAISAGKVNWRKTYVLQPFETAALQLRQLQLQQVKDDDDHVLPIDANSGQIDWSNSAGPRGTGRLLVSNRGLQMARSFSCASYFNLCGVSISPSSPQNISVNSSISFNTSNVAFCWGL